jgi:hypothetical protein
VGNKKVTVSFSAAVTVLGLNTNPPWPTWICVFVYVICRGKRKTIRCKMTMIINGIKTIPDAVQDQQLGREQLKKPLRKPLRRKGQPEEGHMPARRQVRGERRGQGTSCLGEVEVRVRLSDKCGLPREIL